MDELSLLKKHLFGYLQGTVQSSVGFKQPKHLNSADESTDFGELIWKFSNFLILFLEIIATDLMLFLFIRSALYKINIKLN